LYDLVLSNISTRSLYLREACTYVKKKKKKKKKKRWEKQKKKKKKKRITPFYGVEMGGSI